MASQELSCIWQDILARLFPVHLEGRLANKITETRKVRQRLGLTQEEMARRLGVALRTFTRWDTGATEPSAPTAELMRSLTKNDRKKRGS